MIPTYYIVTWKGWFAEVLATSPQEAAQKAVSELANFGATESDIPNFEVEEAGYEASPR